MASLGSPLRTFRGLLRELRYALGGSDVSYRNKAAYRYLKEAFRCHLAATYLCLLHSIREHLVLHKEYHGKGERSPDIVAGLVGFKLPQQPGGKGWEP
ncbi:putative UPF0562 C7orf55-like protein [Naja naja]|nr:putative UPF0562 C7orf55-like protein [Naja naja]